MAQVEIKWLQRVNGRSVGDVEIVEFTEYTHGLVVNNRIQILRHVPIVGVFQADPVHQEAPVLAGISNDLDAVAVDDKPKPRQPRKPKVTEE